ncbi:MAG: GNAT family N-acetyltransferase [Acidimicrobiales bacterium]|jgi:GNAT superfamily N-acetyltransferase
MVPGRAADEIDGLRRALGSTEVARIAPHVTLVPPVNVRDEDVQTAADLVRSVAAGSAPLAVVLGPAATFWPANPVCYLAVAADAAAADAAASDRVAADPAGLGSLASRLAAGPLAPPPKRRTRPFVPHVTINQRMPPELIESAVRLLSSYRTPVVFQRVTLLEFSERERRWLTASDAQLGASVVVGRGGFEIELSVSSQLDPAGADWASRAWGEYSLEQYGDTIRPDEPYVITARLSGQIGGIAEGEVKGATCRLARLVVAPQWRRHGVGAQLLRATERLAAERGCRRVRLEALAGGRAEGFYEEKGYQVVASVPQHREERDFVVMERAIEAV